MTAPAPRLRIKRVAIVESRSPLRIVREVELHDGLNIVWAEELATEAATEVERAGHGVGKSTFTLMLRAVLGDDGVAVKTMRRHLAEHYGTGGVAAEVAAGAKEFAVFRSFGTQSFALRHARLEALFDDRARDASLDFADYVTELGEEACLQHLQRRVLPVTNQSVDWSSVLCWLARDQSLGLREYFEWRKDDGAGLQRKVKDPPALVRLVLGLLSDEESKAEKKIAEINTRLAKARETQTKEEQRSSNIRSLIETQLREWAVVSSALPMDSDDLFETSVQREIRNKTASLEKLNETDRREVAKLDEDLATLAADIKSQDLGVQLAKAKWDELVALRKKDQKSLTEIKKLREKLLTLSGICRYGAVAYDDCSYVQEQRSTVSLSEQRHVTAIAKSLTERGDQESVCKENYAEAAKHLKALTDAQETATKKKQKLGEEIEMRQRRLGESDSLRKTLDQWKESREEVATEKLRAARDAVLSVERELEGAKNNKIASQRMSKREQQISRRLAALATSFGVTGRYVPTDEKRPFQMLGTDGDAYTPLEILLGDLTCAEEGANGKGAHPALLIFDCPRERELSGHLYERFLELVDEVCRASPGLQVILTTTTPPPARLRKPPTRVLRLSRETDDLLLKRRLENLLTRTRPSSQDEE